MSRLFSMAVMLFVYSVLFRAFSSSEDKNIPENSSQNVTSDQISLARSSLSLVQDVNAFQSENDKSKPFVTVGGDSAQDMNQSMAGQQDFDLHSDKSEFDIDNDRSEFGPDDVRSENDSNALEVVYITPTSGYVQTTNWDGKSAYEANLNCSAEVVVPEDYEVMLSLTDLDVEGGSSGKCTSFDSVNLYLDNTSHTERVWKACGDYRPLPAVYNTRRFLVHFKTDVSNGYRVSMTGFRLHFSFHNRSALPEKLSNGTWDCSVSYWSDFRRHLFCNLEEECSDSRDEAECSYTSELCGPGRLTAGGACFFYLNLRRQTPWKEAQLQCFARGGRLASLTTYDMWTDIIYILRGEWINSIYVGLTVTSLRLPDVYHNLYKWSDGTTAFYFNMDDWQDPSGCGVVQVWFDRILMDLRKRCEYGQAFPFLCSVDMEATENRLHTEEKEGTKMSNIPPNPIKLSHPEAWSSKFNISVVNCPDGHVAHTFLACDEKSSCFGQSSFSKESCSVQLTPLPPSFACDNGVEHVPYTLVCDHRNDCGDGSDEIFCQKRACHWLKEYQCESGQQCIPRDQVCDGHKQCVTGSDEEQCVQWRIEIRFRSPKPPAVVDFDSDLNLHITEVNATSEFPVCPVSHFQCPSKGYCLPVFLRCNGIDDCPDKSDEKHCENHSCPGFYRCRASQVCVHADNMCDGVFHCPQHDDELLCHLRCPQGCVCYGLAFYCSQYFLADEYPDIRFLDAGNSMMKPSDFQNNPSLVFLSLVRCGLQNLEGLVFPNLRILNVAYNQLTSVRTSELKYVPNLRELHLADNPLVGELFIKDTSKDFVLPSLQSLDLARIHITELNTRILSVFPNLQSLNFTDCGIDRVVKEGFGFLPKLRVIDLRGSRMTYFSRDLFSGLSVLQSVHSDNYKVCCPSTLPKRFNVLNCHAPMDEISSCDALLRSDFFRILLFVFAGLAIAGNLGSFVYRVCFSPSVAHGYGVMVTHLSVSDFLMGIYLLVIGIADQCYRGSYLWKDVEWRHGAACKMAGFLSFLSSEVSVFIICLITFDRFVVISFPFSRLCLTRKSAHIVCALAWVLGLVLAAIPLLPVTSHWQFYSQTGICIPLPVTRQKFAGHGYSFSVMIVLNLVLFILIAAGQFSIYWSIRTNSMASSSSSKPSKDLTIARRLVSIAVTDFLCWFPICLLGLLASNDVPISSEVSVVLAIVALPLNSAINPFLYTLNTILERRRHMKEERLKKIARIYRLDTMTSVKHVETALTDFPNKISMEEKTSKAFT